MKLDVEHLGRRIGQLRTHRRWSTRTLAEVAGVSHQYVRLVELGQVQRPGLERLDRLAVALGWSDIHALLASEALEPPLPAPSLSLALIEAAVERTIRRVLAGFAYQPDGPPLAEQAQERQALGDKYLPHPAAALAPRAHGGHSTRRRISPTLVAA